MAFLRRSYITCMLWARRRTCLCRSKLLQLASFSTLAPSVLGNLSWSFANLKKTSRAFALRAGTSLVEYCYVLLKFAQAPLRLDRIVIQLFVMLGHYLQVFLLLFLVEEEQSLSRAIFRHKKSSPNRFEELLWTQGARLVPTGPLYVYPCCSSALISNCRRNTCIAVPWSDSLEDLSINS